MEARRIVAAKSINLRPDIDQVVIFGHADETGGAERNEKLSQQRAWTAREALIRLRSRMPPCLMAGFSCLEPERMGGSADALAANRRVVILLLREVVEPPVALPAEALVPTIKMAIPRQGQD